MNEITSMENSISSCLKRKVPNKEFASYLLTQGIFFTPEFNINNYIYDFRIGHYVIDIDSHITNNSSRKVDGQEPISEQYHRNKTLNALNNGFTCVHIFDWVNPGAILYGIINESLHIVDTGKVVKHIFDVKKKQLTNQETPNTVVIYDDGFDVIY